jgi:hypothetical protein
VGRSFLLIKKKIREKKKIKKQRNKKNKAWFQKTHGNCPWYWENTIRKRTKKEKEKGRVKI